MRYAIVTVLLAIAIALAATVGVRAQSAPERVTLGPISEETSPASCPSGFALSSLRCSGGHCDNIAATCMRYAATPANESQETAYWTPWFSEENTGDGEVLDGSNFPRLTDPYAVAVGIQCRGSYCDEMRLMMLPLRGQQTPTLDSKADQPICRLSPKFSEERPRPPPPTESPRLPAGVREFVHRVGCSGGYCDNLQIEWCRVFPPTLPNLSPDLESRDLRDLPVLQPQQR